MDISQVFFIFALKIIFNARKTSCRLHNIHITHATPKFKNLKGMYYTPLSFIVFLLDWMGATADE